MAGFIDLSRLCGEAEEVHGDANVVGQDIPGAGSSRSPPWQGVMAHGVLSRWRWPYLDLHHFLRGPRFTSDTRFRRSIVIASQM
mgnify:CR=1 FL=1